MPPSSPHITELELDSKGKEQKSFSARIIVSPGAAQTSERGLAEDTEDSPALGPVPTGVFSFPGRADSESATALLSDAVSMEKFTITVSDSLSHFGVSYGSTLTSPSCELADDENDCVFFEETTVAPETDSRFGFGFAEVSQVESPLMEFMSDDSLAVDALAQNTRQQTRAADSGIVKCASPMTPPKDSSMFPFSASSSEPGLDASTGLDLADDSVIVASMLQSHSLSSVTEAKEMTAMTPMSSLESVIQSATSSGLPMPVGIRSAPPSECCLSTASVLTAASASVCSSTSSSSISSSGMSVTTTSASRLRKHVIRGETFELWDWTQPTGVVLGHGAYATVIEVIDTRAPQPPHRHRPKHRSKARSWASIKARRKLPRRRRQALYQLEPLKRPTASKSPAIVDRLSIPIPHIHSSPVLRSPSEDPVDGGDAKEVGDTGTVERGEESRQRARSSGSGVPAMRQVMDSVSLPIATTATPPSTGFSFVSTEAVSSCHSSGSSLMSADTSMSTTAGMRVEESVSAVASVATAAASESTFLKREKEALARRRAIRGDTMAGVRRDKAGGVVMAVKKNKNIFSVLKDAQRMYREVRILTHLSGQCDIINLLDVVVPSDEQRYRDIYLMMPRMDWTLAQTISSKLELSRKHWMFIGAQILRGLSYIHAAGVIHRDIKPENILLCGHNSNVKITDFGCAIPMHYGSGTAFQDHHTEYVSTRWYRAPEVMWSRGAYGPAMDCWAVGCVLGEMALRQPLFPGQNHYQQMHLIFSLTYDPRTEAAEVQSWIKDTEALDWIRNVLRRLERPITLWEILAGTSHDCDGHFLALLKRLLDLNPATRMSASEALDDEFFSSMFTPRTVDTKQFGQVPKFKVSAEELKHMQSKAGLRKLLRDLLEEFHSKQVSTGSERVGRRPPFYELEEESKRKRKTRRKSKGMLRLR